MTLSVSSRDHVSATILEAAATVLAGQGDGASMAHVAEAAGMARATLYRYFPTRDQLVGALLEAAVDEAQQRLDEADLPSVPVPEAVARMTRALVACGSKFAVILNDLPHGSATQAALHLRAPMYQVFSRGVADGTLREDVSADVLVDLYRGLLRAAARMTLGGSIGVEQASVTAVALFFDGARAAERRP